MSLNLIWTVLEMLLMCRTVAAFLQDAFEFLHHSQTSLAVCHYENMPMQYTVIFRALKNRWRF